LTHTVYVRTSNLYNVCVCVRKIIITPPPIASGSGYCFRSISFFLCFFVSNITRKRLDRYALNFQGMCGLTMGGPDYISGQFLETARCRDANFFVSIDQRYQQSAFLAVLCCHLAIENVMNLATSQHGGGVCYAFAPQLVTTLANVDIF